MTGRRPGRQRFHRAQQPVGRRGPWGPLALRREASAVSGRQDGRGRPCQGPESVATARGGRDGLPRVDAVPVLFLARGPRRRHLGKEAHPLGLTGQQEGLSRDEKKDFLHGKVIRPWDELWREAVEGAS